MIVVEPVEQVVHPKPQPKPRQGLAFHSQAPDGITAGAVFGEQGIDLVLVGGKERRRRDPGAVAPWARQRTSAVPESGGISGRSRSSVVLRPRT